jgi:hypothetical protein
MAVYSSHTHVHPHLHICKKKVPDIQCTVLTGMRMKDLSTSFQKSILSK